MSDTLAERLLDLRDSVLGIEESGDDDPPGAEIYDAVVRAVMAHEETSPGLDMALHDAVSRRLAWGEREEIVLADAEEVYDRLIVACQEALDEPVDEMLLAEIATEVVCVAARVVAQAAVSRAGRERAACLREELTQRRLQEALKRQDEDLARLQALIGDAEKR